MKKIYRHFREKKEKIKILNGSEFWNRLTLTNTNANIKNTILNTDNIRSITSYTGSIDPTTRKYKVVFSAITDSGDIINNIEVEI